MKSFKQFTAESSLLDIENSQDLGDSSSKEKQKAFIDKHLVDVKELPDGYKQAEVLDLSGNRLADHQKGEDAEVYESVQEGTVSEAEMTDAQKAKREEIIKELKKKMDEFKDRYGDRATDVMYATATKMAMKDDSEDEDEEDLDEAKYPKKSKFPSHEYLPKSVQLKGFDKNKKKRLKKSSDYKLDGSDKVKLRGFKGKKLPKGFEEVEVEEGYQEGYYKEGVLQDLEMIVKKKSVGDVKFSDGKKQKVDLTTASMIVSMVKQLNKQNQKKVLNMLDNSKTFKDVAKFAFSAGK